MWALSMAVDQLSGSCCRFAPIKMEVYATVLERMLGELIMIDVVEILWL